MLVARERERATLREAERSQQSELVAVYGRRRVGKTFLVREHFGEAIRFELVGIHRAALREQLANFAASLDRAGGPAKGPPASWRAAFRSLADWLDATADGSGRKIVLFFDELPWLAGRRSGFLSAFEHFWNAWATRRHDILAVICGSASSWMLRRVVHQRGGLHNRVTQRIRLLPFTLTETETYLASRNIDVGRYQLLLLYMVFGGVPFYLAQIRIGDSAIVAIERVCLQPDGILRDEFPHLYQALFDKAERHEHVVRVLATRRGGATRQQLVDATGLGSGGALTTVLEELEQSGFVSAYPPVLGRIQRKVYRLTDEYSMFYLTWMQRGGSRWAPGSPSWHAWVGLAFESLCAKHAHGIKVALGIGGVATVEAPWAHRPVDDDDVGAQIDLVIVRQDHTTNLCEMKFVEDAFVVTKAYAAELRRKRATYSRVTRTRHQLVLTVVAPYGLYENRHVQELGLIGVDMDALFHG